MNRIIIALSSVIIFSSSISSQAAETIGQITGVIDSNQIDLQVRCEYLDPPGFLNARSDWNGNQQSDTDGDGFFISAGGMKAIGRVAVVFQAGEQIYKFGHKGDFDQTGLLISDEFYRKDGTSYKADLALKCE